MVNRGMPLLIAGLVWLTSLGATAHAQVPTAAAGKALIILQDGQEHISLGRTYRAIGALKAIEVTSTEFQTLAVVSGAVRVGNLRARSGQALVAPIDGSKVERFGYDAQRLSATLRPDWLADLSRDLNSLAGRQKRSQFWGLHEALGINVTAPSLPAVEAVRASYLSNPIIVGLRHEAQGNKSALATATLARFTRAFSDQDKDAIASLIDPYPFLDAGGEASIWQAARLNFASELLSDKPLALALSQGRSVGETPTTFKVGPENQERYQLTLVERDRAYFVASVELLP